MTDAACFDAIKDLRREVNDGFRTINDNLLKGAGTMADHGARITNLEEGSGTHPALPAVILPPPAPAAVADTAPKLSAVWIAVLTGAASTIGGAVGTGVLFLLQHSAKGTP